MYEGEELSTNKLLSKMRSKEYRWVLVLAEELGLVRRSKRATQKNAIRPQPKTGRRQWSLLAEIDEAFAEIARTTNRGFLEEPQLNFRAEYGPADTWDTSTVIYSLTDAGRHFAEMAVETSALQMTKTHRYRP
jgi:hypothetical protein